MIDATRLGTLEPDELAVALRPLWEDAGPLATCLAGHEVSTWNEHLDLAEAAIASMDDTTRELLLTAHPRIGADPSRLSALSYREQGGGSPAEPAILERLETLNKAYEERFGFPFVEWLAGRAKSEILTVLETRLTRSKGDEREAGCRALVAIARDRYDKLSRETRVPGEAR
ncbi:MAG: 2-oxo-4-hydroxy-4-carboxy-5-ureidoimidazoline decarboxylase [Acidimicrobiaceae bacterium]|nr:2-oxo-4-hydroxy-4-carboxy-5-ureidoimidazoline decarboxylase [Acidimicrobiaceae bacterium]